MNTFTVIFAVVLASAAAQSGQINFSQDTTGNYKLSYDAPEISRSEEGFAGGKVVGTYTYTDKEGTVHTIKYLSSTAGFAAEGADIPIPVQEPAEVLAVRAAHQAKQDHQRSTLPQLSEAEQGLAAPAPASFAAPILVAQPQFLDFAPPKPAQVDNTAEIEAAKAFHFAAHQEAKARLAAAYAKIASA